MPSGAPRGMKEGVGGCSRACTVGGRASPGGDALRRRRPTASRRLARGDFNRGLERRSYGFPTQ